MKNYVVVLIRSASGSISNEHLHVFVENLEKYLPDTPSYLELGYNLDNLAPRQQVLCQKISVVRAQILA